MARDIPRGPQGYHRAWKSDIHRWPTVRDSQSQTRTTNDHVRKHARRARTFSRRSPRHVIHSALAQLSLSLCCLSVSRTRWSLVGRSSLSAVKISRKWCTSFNPHPWVHRGGRLSLSPLVVTGGGVGEGVEQVNFQRGEEQRRRRARGALLCC